MSEYETKLLTSTEQQNMCSYVDDVFIEICKELYLECHDTIYKLFNLTENGLADLIDVNNYQKVMDDIISRYVLKMTALVSGSVDSKQKTFMSEKLIKHVKMVVYYYPSQTIHKIMDNIRDKLKLYQAQIVAENKLVKDYDKYMDNAKLLLNA